MISEAIRAIGARFTPDDYLLWTRIEGTAWTLADLAIVFCLIRLGNLCRRQVGRRYHLWSYVIWALTAAVTCVLPFAPDGERFFQIELRITIPHFFIILYILVADSQIAAKALARWVQAAQAGLPLQAGKGDALDEVALGGKEEDDDGQSHHD